MLEQRPKIFLVQVSIVLVDSIYCCKIVYIQKVKALLQQRVDRIFIY